jgi:hypothetical protein
MGEHHLGSLIFAVKEAGFWGTYPGISQRAIISKELLPFKCGIIAARLTEKEVTDTIFRERQRMIPHRERRGMTRKRVLHREMELISLLHLSFQERAGVR